MLGRTNDTDGDGMSDAYEHLVSHTSPTNADAPLITFQPLSQDVVAGDTATFTVAASGPAPLAYQWMLNGTNIVGETNVSLSLGNIVWDLAGDYSVRVTSPVGLSVTSSNATLWVEDPWGWYYYHAPTYIPILSSRQDFTFKNGSTYVIISPIQFYGRTTVQGGATIKFDTWQNSTIQIMGTLVTDTKPYLPAILTCVDDDAYGDYVDWSNDAPAMHTNGVAYLDLTLAQDTQPAISNLRLSYADQAVTIPAAAGTLDVWDCQFLQCNAALANTATNAAAMGRLHNVLLAGCQAAALCSGTNVTITGEHVTADVTDFSTGQAQPARIGLTNSIIVGAMPSGSAVATDHCAINPTAPVFQTNAAGSYYLTDGSPYHRAGTTSISQRLLSALQQKSTQPPLALPALLSIAGELTLGPQVSRYTNGAPDYGFYYDALDYTVTWMTNCGKMTVLPGTAIGFRKEYSPTLGHLTWLGLDLREGSAFVGQGTPTKPAVFADIQFVQEQQQFPCSAFFMFDFWPNDSDDQAPSLDFRFCNFYASPDANLFWSGYDAYYDYIYSPDSLVDWSLQDCRLHGGRITLGEPTGAMPDWIYGSGAISWKNNLFDNVAIDLDPTLYEFNSVVNCDLSLDARNNLFLGGRWFRMQPIPAAAGNWVFKDNLFDKTDFIQNTNSPLDFNYNAYWPLSTSELAWDWYIYPWYEANTNQLCATTNGGGGNEQFFSTAPPYQRGPLADYYLPITTPLYHAGSRAATDAGLYHYTTRVDQTKEGSGALVNIGLHYVATTGSGSSQPKDSDGDGIPDFVENASGTGSVGPNETDWQNQYTTSGVFDPTNSVYDDIDLSGNGLVGRIKKALGVQPFDTSNPLALSPLLTGEEPDIVTFEVPVSYDAVIASGTLSLSMNGAGVTLADCTRATNGNCLLSFNADFDPAGLHYLSATFRSAAEPGSPHPASTAGGLVQPFCSSNSVQFWVNASMFDDAGAFLDAKLFVQQADYTIDLYDPSTTPRTHIMSITNSTSSGMIQEDWGTTNADGTAFTGTTVQAVFSVTPSGSANALPGKPSKVLTRPAGALSEWGPNFDVAYMYTPTN
ncbi:MAG: immunoglobulin domain-containing protein, partial [Verrucomicrobiota bacterium]